MGMFDHVKHSAPCPNCQTIITDWQSKDGPCLLKELEPWQVFIFYTSCPNCKYWVEAMVDAEVEHVVKRCDIKITAKLSPWTENIQSEDLKKAVPEWIKKIANESEGKVLSLEEMRNILSKCGSLSEEIIRERHGDEEPTPDEQERMKYNTECGTCGVKIEIKASSPGEAYRLLKPIVEEHVGKNHPDRKFDSEFPVWAGTGAQVVFPVCKKLPEDFPLKGSVLRYDDPTGPVEDLVDEDESEITKNLNRLADEGVLDDNEWINDPKFIEKREKRVREVKKKVLMKMLDLWSKEPVDEETQEIIERLSRRRSPQTDRTVFEEFFESAGVAYQVGEGGKACISLNHPGRCHPAYASHLHVSQAMFLFDEQGRYLGVLADEMGFFCPKQ